MKRIRIGKDISMRWEITTDGVAIPLEGRDLTIEIKSPAGIENNIPYRVDGNILIMTFYGYEQKRTGEYSITLWEKKGKPGQNVVDVIRAFELVRTSQEEDDFVGGDLQIESVDLGTENFDILTEGGYRAINIDTLQTEALYDSININGKTYSNESFTITLPKANLDSAGVMSADDKKALQDHGNSISQLESTTSGHSNAISQINAKLDEHTDSINAKITTDRIENGAVTSEKIATTAFDSTLSVSGKIAPADVVGRKLSELEKNIYQGNVSVSNKLATILLPKVVDSESSCILLCSNTPSTILYFDNSWNKKGEEVYNNKITIPSGTGRIQLKYDTDITSVNVTIVSGKVSLNEYDFKQFKDRQTVLTDNINTRLSEISSILYDGILKTGDDGSIILVSNVIKETIAFLKVDLNVSSITFWKGESGWESLGILRAGFNKFVIPAGTGRLQFIFNPKPSSGVDVSIKLLSGIVLENASSINELTNTLYGDYIVNEEKSKSDDGSLVLNLPYIISENTNVVASIIGNVIQCGFSSIIFYQDRTWTKINELKNTENTLSMLIPSGTGKIQFIPVEKTNESFNVSLRKYGLERRISALETVIPTEYNGGDFSAFAKCMCAGDSLTAGGTNAKGGKQAGTMSFSTIISGNGDAVGNGTNFNTLQVGSSVKVYKQGVDPTLTGYTICEVKNIKSATSIVLSNCDSLNTTDIYEYSVDFRPLHKYDFPTQLSKISGVEVVNISYSGITSYEWYNRYKNDDRLIGIDCCILQLGANDGRLDYSQSVLDIMKEFYPSASMGMTQQQILDNVSIPCIKTIIELLQIKNNKIKIFISGIIDSKSYSCRYNNEEYYKKDQMLRKVYNDYFADDNSVFFIDHTQYGHLRNLPNVNNKKMDNWNMGHPSAYGYWRLAKDYYNYISWIMANDKNGLFRNIQYTGTQESDDL